MLVDCLLIVFISICTALLGEGLTWLMVYRTDKYKKLKSEVEKQSKKLEKQREAGMDVADRNQKKKLERQEEKLKNNSRDLSLVKMKSMFAIGFAFTALLSMFNSITSKSYLVWPLQELLTNKESDSSHPHLNLLNDKLVKI
ncbi:calcium load-activated calcium channel isoform X1 [Octopus vulgaris]|uniref:Calcium load-activated calcium channel isoform X1 n=1 Tax=Octopus vulgaris TaxID=6645 RepID=A0AA36BXX4_OCTVU|nr:calcium load-activated calcium channel isoform X1 [Octopus vulgaris]